MDDDVLKNSAKRVVQTREFAEIPAGKCVADLLPVFKGIRGEFRVGEPNKECACCRKPFNEVVKPSHVVKLYPASSLVSVVVELRICGRCVKQHKRTSYEAKRVMAAIEAYCFEEVQQ